jgi:hypothetical protein
MNEEKLMYICSHGSGHFRLKTPVQGTVRLQLFTRRENCISYDGKNAEIFIANCIRWGKSMLEEKWLTYSTELLSHRLLFLQIYYYYWFNFSLVLWRIYYLSTDSLRVTFIVCNLKFWHSRHITNSWFKNSVLYTVCTYRYAEYP